MLHAIDQGRGIPVVLLHGFCENSSLWSDLVSRLSPSYHLIAPDLPGHGKSALPEKLSSLNQVATMVRQFLEQQGIAQFTVIGHSLGGYVGLAMLDLFPESINALGLFHSTALADTPEKRANRNKTMEFIGKYGDTPFKETFIPSLYHREYGWKDDLVHMVMNTPVETIQVYTSMMRDRPNRLHVWQQASLPSMLIGGVYDVFIPLDSLEKQAEALPGIQFHVLQNSGHLGMWEEPEASLDILEKFLSGLH